MPSGVNRMYTDEDCADALWRVARKLGRPPNRGKYDIERLATEPSASTVGNRLGDRTWDSTLETVGLAGWDGSDDSDGGVSNVITGP